jgi:hypothetical protein
MLAVEPLSLPKACTHLQLFRMFGHNHIMALVTLYGTPVHCSLAKLLFSHKNILPYRGFPFSNKVANTMIVCEIHMHSFLYPPSHGVIFIGICHMLSNVYTLFPGLTHSWPKK